MSVLHAETIDGRRVEVRGHGRTRRLYVDGVLHTAWNPGRPVTGAIWDHLALSTFFVDERGARDVLMLGVGGGSALRMIDDLSAPDRLVGVELDGDILRLARRHFGLDACTADIHEGDARTYMARRPRARFDLVIDDLFGVEDGEPMRPAGLDGPWWRRLAGHVRPGGALVVNFLTMLELTSSPLCQDLRFRRRFPAAFRFSAEMYENCVTVLLSRPVSARTFRTRIARHPVLGTAAARRYLKFGVHRLWPR